MAKRHSTDLTRSIDTPTALSHYNPQKGTKKIAFLEMAEKHYAKAKDAGRLTEAIRAKLEAQAEFVYWWDTQVEKQQGSRGVGKKVALEIGDATPRAGHDGLPDRATIHRWRSKLNDPGKFEATYASVCAKYPKLLEFISTPAQSHNSGENEWYTPTEYVEAARHVLGSIDLDPASSETANGIIKAERIFTAADDGREQEWAGRVWMNPPYSQPLVAEFCEKLAASVEANAVTAAVVLVNNATETQWFQRLVSVASAMCFPLGRIRFWSPGKDSAAPLQGQALIYFGPEAKSFTERFQEFGFVVEVISVRA